MNRLGYWLGAAVIITVVYLTIAATVQHLLRIGANDPQIQMAEDGAARLGQGEPATNLLGGDVDVATSLAPFLIIYDVDGRVVASSARLRGTTPTLPVGVLHQTSPGNENRLTWQPRPGVRLASVVVASGKGYVLSGRSLREVEQRASDAEHLIAAAWAGSLVVLTIAFLVPLLPRPSRFSSSSAYGHRGP